MRKEFVRSLSAGTALMLAIGWSAGASAQVVTGEVTQEAATPTGAATPQTDATGAQSDSGGRDIIVTGSRIRQDPNNSALPLQIVTTQEIERNAISSPEQLLMYLPTSGTGPENLASNADVTTGAQRGTNGLSAANLRGQGAAATLVLLNGRRVAAHGLSGSAVDVNQIPFAAIERVEVLKDGASAIYGTDAIGGVINFITKTSLQGVVLNGFVDITEKGDSPIYRISGIAGHGDLQEDGWNVMASVSQSWRGMLFGRERDFVNGNQPERGLSIDTRGTPFATAFPLNPSARYFPGGTLLGGTGTNATVLPTLVFPGTTQRADGGINVLDLPGGPGCGAMEGGLPYDEQLWNAPGARFACSWDTGRAVVIQQPIETLTYFGRAVARIGGAHDISVEVTGSDATSARIFSNPQVSSNTTNLQVAYPRNELTRETYDAVYNAILAQFPGIAANFGKPIGFRWRCIECGPRENTTNSKTFRVAAGVEGPLFSGWDYRVGASYARSETNSLLGRGYYFRGTLNNGAPDPNAPIATGATLPGLLGVLNSGLVNPFALQQTDAAREALASISAEGEILYGGRYEVRQIDASFSGGLFELPGGTVQAAIGVDYRRETYRFNGSEAAAANQPVIFLAAFDNANALTPRNRDVRAAFAEVLIPIIENFEITAAARVDDYTGFGSTVNPKLAARFRPIEQILVRGSYNTGFRVPTFNQIFNGRTESPTNTGANIADPATCPTPTRPDPANPGCGLIIPVVTTGGNPDLGPESAEQYSVGIVFTPFERFSASLDFWSISVDDTIQLFTFRELLENAALFPDRFIRENGALVEIDSTWANAGSRRTQGLEVALRGGMNALGGSLSAGLDGTYLLKKRERLTEGAEFGPSLIGVFSFSGDLGLRWKHNAFVSYTTDDVVISLSQIHRAGYRNGALPGILAGTVTRPGYNERVDSYTIYNLSVGIRAVENMRFTFGVSNLFDRDPPFAITYDGLSGAGSSWEPRVANPRGRAFTVAAEARF